MAIRNTPRVDEYFHEALALPHGERVAFLDKACRGDEQLRAELQSLLTAHESVAAFLAEPIVSATDFAQVSEPRYPPSAPDEVLAPGTTVGRYRIEGMIASGGMGAVYRAVRADDTFEQQVAVKLIRRGMLTDTMRRRFHKERQTLARLEHPGITRLIDGGTTAGGIPYLVMEYVEGMSIDIYGDERRLRLRERLELIRSVCEAVHFAHQNLIVHRDLKPRNILVTETGRVKLLDFGIAGLIDEGTDAVARDATVTELRAWTPRYASPEQVRGEPITTATDIYSLGIVLYELLTGRRPYQLDGTSFAEAERIVCEQMPVAPSIAVTCDDGVFKPEDAVPDSNVRLVARADAAHAEEMRRNLRGDLDNIVLKALAKEPARRYASVQHFSEDIRCYLDGLPVAARKDTLAYRATKWVGRNRGIALAGFVALVAMLLGIVGAMTGLVQARRAERTAQLERNAALQAQDEAQAVTRFLQDVFAAANPYRRARDVTVEELLADASKRVPIELSNQPAVEASVRLAIARTYAGMWSWREAAAQLRVALPLFRTVRGDTHADVAVCLSLLGRALTFGNDPDSVRMQREALDIRLEHYGKDHPLVAESWGNLAYAQWSGVAQPNWYAAEINYRRAIDMYERTAPDDLSNRARFTFSLGVMLSALNRLDESARLMDEALELYRAMPIPEDRYVLECMKRYAFVLVRLGRFEEAEVLIRETAQMTPDMKDAPDGTEWLWNQARILSERGSLDQAEALFRSVLAGACDNLARSKPEFAQFAERFSPASATENDDVDYIDVISRLRRHDGYGARTIAFRAVDLAVLECRKGRHDRALPIFKRCLEVVAEQMPADDWRYADVNLAYGECLLHNGDCTAAKHVLRDAHRVLLDVFGVNHALAVRAATSLEALGATCPD